MTTQTVMHSLYFLFNAATTVALTEANATTICGFEDSDARDDVSYFGTLKHFQHFAPMCLPLRVVLLVVHLSYYVHLEKHTAP